MCTCKSETVAFHAQVSFAPCGRHDDQRLLRAYIRALASPGCFFPSLNNSASHIDLPAQPLNQLLDHPTSPTSIKISTMRFTLITLLLGVTFAAALNVSLTRISENLQRGFTDVCLRVQPQELAECQAECYADNRTRGTYYVMLCQANCTDRTCWKKPECPW